MSDIQQRRRSRGDTIVLKSRLLLAAVLSALLCSAAGAQVAQPPSTPAETDDADVAEEEPDGASESGSEPSEPAAAAATESVKPPSDVEVIRIKGRAVTAIEAEVPTSVTQFDAGAIEALGVQNIGDLSKVTPNVEIVTASATAATFFIRGVGLSDFNANAAGAVAIYMDDVALNAPAIQLGQLFDIENVDILRGPQGSGSGRNASAGAIKSYSRKPTGEFGAQLRSSIGSYYAGDAKSAMIQDYEGAVEFPLVKEMLAARFAFRLRDSDPYKKNRCYDLPPFDMRVENTPPNTLDDARLCGENVETNRVSEVPPGLPKHFQDEGNWAARGQLRFQPPDTEMDWILNLHGSRLDQDSTLGQAIGTGTRGEDLGLGTQFGYRDRDQILERDRLFDENFQQFFDEAFPTFREPCEERFPGNETRIVRCQTVGNGNGANRIPGATETANSQINAILAKNLAEDRPEDLNRYAGAYDRIGKTTLDTWGGFLRGDFSIGRVDVTTLSAYDGYTRFRDTDQDFTPDVLFEAIQKDSAWQVSQNLDFSGELEDEPLRWDAGGYFLYENLNADVDQRIHFNGQDFVRVYEQDLLSVGIYGGGSWDFLDDFTLEGGVRYNYEQKHFDFAQTRIPMGGQPIVTTNQCPDCVQDKSWSAPTGTISLTYRFQENANVYWKYSRGFKAGHFNSSQADDTPAKPETIDAFEVGLNGSWLENRLSVRSSLFYYKYAEYQVFFFSDSPDRPPQLLILNAHKAEVYGGELDFRLEPLTNLVPSELDGLVLTGRFGWLESEFLDFTNTVFRSSTTGTIPVLVDYSGNELISSPRFKFSGGAEWTFDLGRWGSIIPRYDFAWTDDQYFSPTEGKGSTNLQGEARLADYSIGQKEFWLHNVRLAYRTPEGNIEVAAWIRNVTDQPYKTYVFDASNLAKDVVNFIGPPRTVGIDLSISW